MFHVHLRRMCNLLFLDEVFYIKSIWSNFSFNSIISLLIFCLDVLSIGVNGVLRSPTIIVLLLMSSFSSIKSCFTNFGAPVLGAYIFLSVMSSWWRVPFIIYILSLFVFLYLFCFEIYLV